MKTLIAVGNHILADVGLSGSPLSFHWYHDYDQVEKGYKAEGRDDGLIYIGGFSTREKAEKWAVKQGIIKEPKPEDDQGEL